MKEIKNNDDTLSGNWKEMTGELKKQWNKLTDDELGQVKGSKDKLLGFLQEKYGYAKQKAQEELDNFLEKFTDKDGNNKLQEMTDQIKDQIKDYSERFEDYVHDCPVKSILAAAGIGLLLGVFIAR